MKKIIYVDMDNVLVDFKTGIEKLDENTINVYEGRLDEVPNIFSLMEPYPNAIDSVYKLSKNMTCIFFRQPLGSTLALGFIN